MCEINKCEACKYGEMCERNKCIYKHRGVENVNDDEQKDDDIHDLGSDDDDAEVMEADKSDADDNIIVDVKEDILDDELEDVKKEKDNEEHDENEKNVNNSTFVNPSQVESEIFEFDVYVTCMDHWLRNDQSVYTQRLASLPEVEKVENVWITPTKDYVGSSLRTNIKFKTKYGNEFKTNKVFKQSFWKNILTL